MKKHLAETLLATIPQRYLDMAKIVSYKPGEYLKRTGDSFFNFCILAEGTVKLLHDNAESPLILDLYHKGDFFGEMEAIGMQTDDRSIVALTDCKVYQFTGAQFLEMWNECSDVSRYILYVHCERLIREGNDKIHAETLFLREKVFRLIQENLNDSNYFMYTKDVLAEMAGISIRSLNRVLAELNDMKMIRLSSGTIRLWV
ncbi:MAG: hypothetical protein CW335_01235 [Clostridiales bacterium]|nr:hypothetical protein [Clostridiales bacterium]